MAGVLTPMSCLIMLWMLKTVFALRWLFKLADGRKRPRARPRRRGKLTTLASIRPTRAPIGTPARIIPSSSTFSHIKTIAPTSRGDIDSDDNQPTFTSTSLQAVVDSTILQSTATEHSESLHSKSMRPTFAAKARAAELNASRARKMNLELSEESSLTMPSSSQVSLGAFTKLKPASRNKANKIWKPLNLNEVYDESISYTAGESQGQVNNERDATSEWPQARSTKLLDSSSQGLRGNYELESIRESPDLQYAEPQLDDHEWDPDMPSLQVRESDLLPTALSRLSMLADIAVGKTPSSSPVTWPVPRSALPASKQVQLVQDSLQVVEPSARRLKQAELVESSKDILSKEHEQEAKLASLGVGPPEREQESKPALLGMNAPEHEQEAKLASLGVGPPENEQEAKLASLGVGPPANTQRYGKQPYPSRHPLGLLTNADDPFIDIGGYNMLDYSSVGVTPFDHNGEYSRRKGTMDREFRFPAPDIRHAETISQHQLQSMPFIINDPTPQLPQYSSFFDGRLHPFSGPAPSPPPPPSLTLNGTHLAHGSRSAKREQLLMSLNNIAEASKARGQSRTVLYDPISAQSHQVTDSTQTEPFPTIAAEQYPPPIQGSKLSELLATSEALPWKDRPVQIHTEVMPSLSNSQLAARGKALEEAMTLNKYNASAETSPASKFSAFSAQRIETANLWFHTDNRGNAQLRQHLDQISDAELAREHVQEKHDTMALPETVAMPKHTSSTQPAAHPATSDIANRLLGPLLVTLQSYLSEPRESQPRQFGRFSAVPEWCIDRSEEGSRSLFGEDWGAPPPRVGRDPRYRPLMHEGRYTVYEEGPGAVGDSFIRRGW